jgi:hypothetical protein
MSLRLLFASGIIAFLSQSCGIVESPLSDVAITEPGVLQIIALAERDLGPSNLTSTEFMVNVYDKHGEYVKVKNGNVTVNGMPMSNSIFGEYLRTGDDITAKSTYTFTVTLSDGSKYSCHVQTPADLHKLNLPTSYDKKAALTVSWQSSDAAGQTTIGIAGDTTSTQVGVSPGQQSITLQPSAFARFHGGQRLRVTVTSTTEGHIDGGFMSTSRVSATFSIAGYLQI